MSWQGIHGHDSVAEGFRRAAERGRVAGSYLFVGPSGIGKRTFALALARSLLCRECSPTTLEACGRCPSCRQCDAGSHPDLHILDKPEEKTFIPVERFIGDREHRMREGLLYEIALKPYAGDRRIAVIDDADFLNAEGANCLLKTLEEPPPGALIILIATSTAKQFPTIRSRCRVVRFAPLAEETVARVLLEQQLVEDSAKARSLAALSQGSVERAQERDDPRQIEFQQDYYHLLGSSMPEAAMLVRTVQQFVEQAGKEANARRGRLRQVGMMTLHLHQAMLRRLAMHRSTSEETTDDLVIEFADRAIRSQSLDFETVADSCDRTLRAMEQVDRMGNLTLVIEAWMEDLARSIGRRPVA